jgi:hypothetical protein
MFYLFTPNLHKILQREKAEVLLKIYEQEQVLHKLQVQIADHKSQLLYYNTRLEYINNHPALQKEVPMKR